MTWLSLLLTLAKLLLGLTETLRERKLIAEGEARAITRAMELTNARLQRAIDARAVPADGSVHDDPYLRD